MRRITDDEEEDDDERKRGSATKRVGANAEMVPPHRRTAVTASSLTIVK